jgi:tripartite-type tricarboxylate transporter receptor subunit TctC
MCVTALLYVLFFSMTESAIWAAPSIYYKDKTITIIVGYGPGGGYDRMARILAKHLPKYIPGKPVVLVENMPGADSIIAANHLFKLAKPDGCTIGTFNRGLVYAQLLNAPGVRFDLLKYAWIGSAAVEATVFTLRSDLPYKSFNDVLKAPSPVMLGSTGPADSTGQFPLLLKEFFNMKMKMINYPSSSDVFLAIERKELDGKGASFSSIRPLIDRGVVRPLLRGRVAEKGIESLPVDEDLTKDSKAKALLSMRSAPDKIGRPYAAPPGTPPEAIKILRDAFEKTSKDPEVQKDAEKVMMSLEYLPADETVEVVRTLLSQPAELVKEFSKFIKF